MQLLTKHKFKFAAYLRAFYAVSKMLLYIILTKFKGAIGCLFRFSLFIANISVQLYIFLF